MSVTEIERVLVVLDDGEETVLEAGAELAARRGSRLVGLFIEDSDLLSCAGLPFAREIGLTSARVRELTTADVEASMRARAERLRARIERLAHERGLDAMLEVGRGRQTHSVLDRARPEDLLVLRRGEWARRPAGALEGLVGGAVCAIAVVGTARALAPGGPMVLVDGTSGALRALSRALALARGEAEPLTVLLTPDEAGRRAQQHARDLLAEHGVRARFIELDRASLAELVRLARRERPRLLFVSRESPLLPSSATHWLAEIGEELAVVLVP